MTEIVKAVIAFIRATPALAAFAGTGGPFWDVAPEKTAKPFMVISHVPGKQLLRGFSGTYGEPVMLRFHVYDYDSLTVLADAEALCNAFDPKTSFTLGNGELCRKPLREESPRLLTEQPDGTGWRVYHSIVEYTFNVQRAVGV